MSVLCVFVKSLILVSLVYAQDSCFTPSDAQGECKVIDECPSLFAILQHRPISTQNADLLRRSNCGFEGTLPKVCCPLTIASSTTRKPTVNVFENAIPVSSPLLPNREICGVDTQDRIYGGEKATLEDFPWMALIEYERDNGKRGFYCGGVLISNRYILTAAHCLKGKDLPKSWKLVSVRLGEYNTETDEDCEVVNKKRKCAPPPLNVPVEERIAHEQYDPFDGNQYHDIALLRLAREVKYSVYVRPICLPNTADIQTKSFTGKQLTVAGWGKTETRSESPIKLKLDVPVKNNEECSSTYKQAEVYLRGAQLCAGGQSGKDSCRGDSGGPLMSYNVDEDNSINWYSIGVVSFGPSPCGMENWPGVYTKVANYVQWIVSKLKP